MPIITFFGYYCVYFLGWYKCVLVGTPAKENTQHQHAAMYAEQCFKYVVTTYQ